jgi:hypothetical protein
VSEELSALRRLAADENQTLLALAGHRLAAAPNDPGTDPPAAAAPDASDEDASDEDASGPGVDPRLLPELRRAHDLLAHIYREMGMVLRSAGSRLEMRQTETLQAIARVIQRMDAQAASGAEQIQILRALLRYISEDDRKLVGLMGVLEQEVARDGGGDDS